jgi:hypothetical protein
LKNFNQTEKKANVGHPGGYGDINGNLPGGIVGPGIGGRGKYFLLLIFFL